MSLRITWVVIFFKWRNCLYLFKKKKKLWTCFLWPPIQNGPINERQPDSISLGLTKYSLIEEEKCIYSFSFYKTIRTTTKEVDIGGKLKILSNFFDHIK